MTPNKTLHIYTRVSTEKQAIKANSLEEQKRLGELYAKNNSFTNTVLYEEKGASASHDNFNNRPELTKLIEKIKRKEVTDVYFFDETRMSRNKTTIAMLEVIFQSSGVSVHYNSGKFNFTNENEILMHSIKSIMSLFDGVNRKNRFQAGNIASNRKGRFTKPITPFGWKKDEKGFLIKDESEAKVLESIIDMYLNKNMGSTQIARYLNENNILPRMASMNKEYILNDNKHNRKNQFKVSNNKWNPGTINSMLKSTNLHGERKFKIENDTNGEAQYETTSCEPIIDKLTYDRIQNKMKYNSSKLKKTTKYFKLLSNLCVCGNCGRSMELRIKPSRGEFTYVCNSKRMSNTSCKSRGINMLILNELVWKIITKVHYIESKGFYDLCQLLVEKNDDYDAKMNKNTLALEENQKKQYSLESQIKKLVNLHISDAIPIEIYTSKYDELIVEKQKLNQIETMLNSEKSTLCNSNLLMDKLKNQFRSISITSKSAEATLNLKHGLNDYNSFPPTIEQSKAREFIRLLVKEVKVTHTPNSSYKIEILFKNEFSAFNSVEYITSTEKSVDLNKIKVSQKLSIFDKIIPFSLPHFITKPQT